MTRPLRAALLAGFVGFQELVIDDGQEVRSDRQVVPLSTLRRANRPLYYDALPAAELVEGTMRAVDADGVPLLIANVQGEIYAIRNRCGDSPLPLEFGTLDGTEIRCSWHGCRYDLRTGRGTSVNAQGVQVFPVAVGDGRMRVALGGAPSHNSP